MKFKNNIFLRYLQEAPAPLAMERVLECEIYKTKTFEHPILDIGCGEGMFAYILFDEHIDTGIDPNNKELNRAQEYGVYQELINCYGNAIPKPDKSYKTIFSNSVLEHIPQIEDVLKEAHRLLVDGGKMYVTVPTNMFDNYSITYQVLNILGMDTLKEKYRKFFNKFWVHFHYYDDRKWRELFEKNGFQVVNTQEYGTKSQCLVNSFLAPLSIVPFISKRLINRWFTFPVLRKPFAYILSKLWTSFITKKSPLEEKHGLIFLELCKR